jgi:hypothetical protein
MDGYNLLITHSVADYVADYEGLLLAASKNTQDANM